MHQLAIIQRDRGNYDEAERLYRGSLEIKERAERGYCRATKKYYVEARQKPCMPKDLRWTPWPRARGRYLGRSMASNGIMACVEIEVLVK
jgi:hypothetical protein